MDSRYKKLKWNSILALFYQAILILTGLVLPRCFLYFYGSEINGLVTSITQFLSFINICDLGISAVVTAAYYTPLAYHDTKQISKIFVYSKRFFRIIGFILIAYVGFMLVAYPTLINNSFDFWFTFMLIVAMSISQLGQYFIGISYQLLLNADQKSYIRLIINGSTLLINTIISIWLMNIGMSIQVVKLTTSLVYLLRPIMMFWYVKKHYEIDYAVVIDKSVVKQKKSGIIQHIAYMIYENTDVMVLTVFSSLNNVSVYSVYTLATNSIKQIITAATTGAEALFGNMIARNERCNLQNFYNFYNWGVHTISALLFTITGLMIVPFVKLYTLDITDTNYYAPIFAILITFAYYLGCIRNCNYVLIRSAGHFKQTQIPSLIEAILNIVLSITFVFNFGLVGVAIGTIISTLFFVIFEVIYFNKNIVFVPIKCFAKQFMVDLFTIIFTVVIVKHVYIFDGSILSWITQAIISTIICFGVTLINQLAFYYNNVKLLKDKIFNKFKR